MAPDSRTGETRSDDAALKLTALILGVLLLIAATVVTVVILTIGRSDPVVAPVGPATLRSASVFDDFDRADGRSLGTPRKGSPWTVYGGEWGIDNHSAHIVDVKGGVQTIAVTAGGSSDGSVQVTLPKTAGGAGVIFRFHDLANYWQLVSAPEYATFALAKVVDGQLVHVGDAGLVGTTDETMIGVLLAGPRITILINEAEVRTFTDPDLESETLVGLIGLPDDGVRARFDDFLVSNPRTSSVVPN